MEKLALAEILLEIRGAVENLEDAVKVSDPALIRQYRKELFQMIEKKILALDKFPKTSTDMQQTILIPLVYDEITYARSTLDTSSRFLSSSISVVS
jgi:hypothetical protein